MIAAAPDITLFETGLLSRLVISLYLSKTIAASIQDDENLGVKWDGEMTMLVLVLIEVKILKISTITELSCGIKPSKL